MTIDWFLLISQLISKIIYLTYPMYSRFFTQWMYAPGFPCQNEQSVSSAMKCKGTVKPMLFFSSSFTYSTRNLEREQCFSQLWNTVFLAISILWIHDAEAGGRTDARTILRRLMQSFQQLNSSQMRLYTDSSTCSLGVMLFVRLPGLDCFHLRWWLDCSKHLAPAYPLKAVGKTSVLKI